MMALLDQIASSPELMKSFQRERLEMEITELICQLMKDQGINRADLANRLGKTRPHVTKLLRDGSNMTVKTISDVFFVLGRSLRVVDRPLSIWTPRLLVVEAPVASAWSIEDKKFNYEPLDVRPQITSKRGRQGGLIQSQPIQPEAA
jgi:transcriptional regulator with XRE-family HTH domain